MLIYVCKLLKQNNMEIEIPSEEYADMYVPGRDASGIEESEYGPNECECCGASLEEWNVEIHLCKNCI